MELQEARELVNRLIETGETHQDYKRTIELAETYRIYITGCEIEKKLIQYVPREDEILFQQRVALTKSITPAVASSIRQPYNKVARIDRIRKDVKLENDQRKKNVEEMIKGFFGAPRKKNRGLQYWMKTRFCELQFIDPNSWVVIEWEAPQSDAQVLKPRPFEVSANEAVNFFVVNDEVKWLFVKQAIKFETVNGVATGGTGIQPGSQVAPGALMPSKVIGKKVEGWRYTIYDEEITVVYEQADADFIKQSGYTLKRGEEIVSLQEKTYLVRSFEPKLGYAPVLRVGYKRDEATKGRTFVNPWHDALCFFDKSLKTVSELDLTMTLHTFPQKLQYVHKCPGKGPEISMKCNRGFLKDGSTCTACRGTGYKLHTTAQDAILLPMPDSPDDLLDLEKILVYKAPPMEIIKFQNEYTQQLERQAHQAVFNSQAFVKKTGAQGTSGAPFQTATEMDYNMESVYDALEPFTEKSSEIWRDIVTTFGILAGEKIEKIEVVYEFPADLKLKTGGILMAERKAAADSGAPAFLIEAIDDDLATITFTGDADTLEKYRVKRRFAPFSGKSADEVAELLTSSYVLKYPKVLYSNFESIFKEIETEKPDFWKMTDIAAQRKIVEAKVQEYIDKLEAEAPKINVDTFREGNPEGGNAGGDGNPGEKSNEDEDENEAGAGDNNGGQS